MATDPNNDEARVLQFTGSWGARMELALAAHADDPDAVQALSLVRLPNCSKEHRGRVRDALDVLEERGRCGHAD